VVLCTSQSQAEEAEGRATALLGELGLLFHPEKTAVVDLRGGCQGFDFLGCHFHARMSGKAWKQRKIVRYYLQRWRSARSIKRARARIKAMTDRRQVGQELPVVIGEQNQFSGARETTSPPGTRPSSSARSTTTSGGACSACS